MRKQNGITLIALVITIIVLLILAGVSIAMLTGENGILSNATQAQIDTDRENAIESIDLALQAIKVEAAAQGVANTAYDATTTTSKGNLVKAVVIGNTIAEDSTSRDTNYTISGDDTEGDTITISYNNASTGVSVSGSIDLSGESGGTITGAK